jgi:CubicO group peptidase (beta-lactamase class C family)
MRSLSAPRSVFLALTGILLPLALAAQDTARMDAVVRSYVDGKTFMGSVLVARDGEVLFSKGYGYANLEWEIPNTPTTKFRLGSVTKQFTAAAVLLLEERGKLKTDDLVKVHMLDAPAAWDNVTIFNLLTHTSGIPDFTSFPEYPHMEPFATSVAEIVAKFRDEPLDFAPGERMSYSNSGYVLLGYLVEKISGESYEHFLQENIFTPLGMKDSGYDSNSAIIARRASGYTPSPGGPVNAGFIHMSIPHGAGALYSTTEDLLRWERALFDGKVLSAAALKKMIAPFKSDYAFGLFVQTIDGRLRISHGGGIEGFNTLLAYYPESKVVTIALANLNGQTPGDIARQLGALAHGDTVSLISERKQIALPRATLAQYVGTYELAPQVKLMITLDGDQLTTQLSGQPKFPVFADSETSFFLKVVDAQLTFEKDPNGAVTAAVLHQNGRDQRAPKVSDTVLDRKEIALSPRILARYVGSYVFPRGEMVVTLEGGELVTQLGPQPKVPLFAESETSFFAKMVDAQIEFKTDASGAVTGLVLHQGPANIEAPRK